MQDHSYFKEIFQKVPNLEAAFEKLYLWDRHSSNHVGVLREWRNLKIAKFKTSTGDWATAMEKLYERATQLQDQLDHEHSYPSHLVEVLETAIRDQPFFVFVD